MLHNKEHPPLFRLSTAGAAALERDIEALCDYIESQMKQSQIALAAPRGGWTAMGGVNTITRTARGGSGGSSVR